MMNFPRIARILPLILLAVVLSASGQTDTWTSYTSKTSGFTVMLPTTPTEETQMVPTEFGEQEMIVTGCDASVIPDSPNMAYIVTYAEYPADKFEANNKEATDQYLRGTIDGMVRNTEGKLLSETTIDMDGIPGREVRISLAEGMGVLTSRVYLNRNKSYTLAVVTEAANDQNTSIGRFFNSFQLTAANK
jgi:hypothetical protein